MSDAINPSHHKDHPSGVECITITEHFSFCLGGAIKYIWRAGLKTESPVEDLEKARWYIDREIARLRDQAPAVASTTSVAQGKCSVHYASEDVDWKEPGARNLFIAARAREVLSVMTRIGFEPLRSDIEAALKESTIREDSSVDRDELEIALAAIGAVHDAQDWCFINFGC